MKKYEINGKVLKILEGVTSICEADFVGEDVENFADLEFVSLPNSLKRIEERAFFDHFVGVKRVDLKNVEHIGSMAFYGMTSLEEIVLTDSIKSIEKHAFCNCENLSINVVCERCLPKDWNEEFYANVKSVEFSIFAEKIEKINEFADKYDFFNFEIDRIEYKENSTNVVVVGSIDRNFPGCEMIEILFEDVQHICGGMTLMTYTKKAAKEEFLSCLNNKKILDEKFKKHKNCFLFRFSAENEEKLEIYAKNLKFSITEVDLLERK